MTAADKAREALALSERVRTAKHRTADQPRIADVIETSDNALRSLLAEHEATLEALAARSVTTEQQHLEEQAAYARIRRQALADAWDEGALWAAVELGAIRDERERWLGPGDNPYREVQTA